MSNKYKLEGEPRRFSLKGLGKVIIELLVIVIGIYLAFALEEYGEKKADKELELKYLNQLLAEAKSNQVELNADQNARREQRELFGYLLENSNRQVGADTLREATRQLLVNRLFSPTDAVYQDLVSSGNLKLIQSDSIRKTIIHYKQRLARAPVTEAVEERLIENKIEPYLLDKQVLSLLEPLNEIDAINISEQQVDRIIRVLLSEREFIDLVYLRYSRLDDVIYFETPLQWSLRDLIKLLEKEIAKHN
ncbi:MAG: hypothetical protein HWE21_03840 [Cytophagia bacterium]|nr:hypothetical protein [Cytophagia bacterium]